MANLSLTLNCNRACSYCFARPGSSAGFMSDETFRQALFVLKRSRIAQLRLLGGEPSLHPRFLEFIRQGRAQGFNVLIFSNGLLGENIRNALAEYDPADLGLLVNVNSPADTPAREAAQQTETFTHLGPRIGLGHNIHRRSPSLSFLLELVDTYTLRRHIRLGLAHPCLGSGNTFLHPKFYPEVGEQVAEFLFEAEKRNILVDLDCGFVPCMFSRQLIEQGRLPAHLGRRCNPMPDLLPEGAWIPCYPFSDLWRIPLAAAEDCREIRNCFTQAAASYRQIGIYARCSDCDWRKSGRCVGGCLATAMQRLHGKEPAFAKPIHLAPAARALSRPQKISTETVAPSWHLPYIDQPLSFWARLAEDYGQHIQSVYLPLPPQFGIPSGRPPQPAQHLAAFLRHGPFRISILLNSITLPSPAKALVPRILSALQELWEEGQVHEVTVSNLDLARAIRDRFPSMRIAASVLLDLASPLQALALGDAIDTLVPSNRIMRQRPALQTLRRAFPGRIRIIVNEACLPGCPYRVQHFHEMGSGLEQPASLCDTLLREKPWLRLTGAWVLPQHLHLYAGLCHEFKLAGRVTLRDPNRYLQVLGAYIRRQPLCPNKIGGGPASVLQPVEIPESFFARTMECNYQCDTCSICRDFHQEHLEGKIVPASPELCPPPA